MALLLRSHLSSFPSLAVHRGPMVLVLVDNAENALVSVGGGGRP